MIFLHIISDLYLEYAEHSDLGEYQVPENTNLIVLNGNIGPLKRCMYHAETLANIYPNIPVVCNLGQTEKYHGLIKNGNEIDSSLLIRQQTNPTWPKNLYWSKDSIKLSLNNGAEVDILCVYGFPKIHSYAGSWESTEWFKNYVIDTTFDHNDPRVNKIEGISNVARGQIPIWASMDWVNQQHELEEIKVRNWELTSTSYKILVTHINPFNDIRFQNQTVSPYKIHLENGLWVTSNQKVESIKFLGARLVSNPGLGCQARSHIVTVDKI